MTIQDILERGYHEYKPTMFDQYVEKCFQKRFDDETGKKYFIEIKLYEPIVHPITGETYPHTYEYETQLHNLDDEPVNLQFFAGWTIDKVELYVEKLFDTGWFQYYERWDEC